MILLFDGPEAAGKSSLIKQLSRHLIRAPLVRQWGPVPGAEIYRDPLYHDYKITDDIVVWDRSWSSEVCYNELLNRGRKIDAGLIDHLESLASVAGYKIMVCASPEVLTRRRKERRPGEDLPVDPEAEMAAFSRYALTHGWLTVSGEEAPEHTIARIVAIAKI